MIEERYDILCVQANISRQAVASLRRDLVLLRTQMAELTSNRKDLRKRQLEIEVEIESLGDIRARQN